MDLERGRQPAIDEAEDAVRDPQQGRSRRSLESVLAAGIEILAEGGYDALSIAAVSERAGVSVGSIYARFKSKATLFAALQKRMLEDIDAEQEQLFAKASGTDAQIVDQAIQELATHFHRKEALLRVMIMRGAVDAKAKALGSASSLRLARHFEAHLLKRIGRFNHEDPALAVDVAFRMVYASLTRRIISGPTFESPREVPWEQFVAEVSRACQLYLVGECLAKPAVGT